MKWRIIKALDCMAYCIFMVLPWWIAKGRIGMWLLPFAGRYGYDFPYEEEWREGRL